MRVQIRWHEPLQLRDGRRQQLIYRIDELDGIPRAPGVYAFGRLRCGKFVPVYIGKAEQLRPRRALYASPRAARRERWSGALRNWTPVAKVRPNPEPLTTAQEAA